MINTPIIKQYKKEYASIQKKCVYVVTVRWKQQMFRFSLLSLYTQKASCGPHHHSSRACPHVCHNKEKGGAVSVLSMIQITLGFSFEHYSVVHTLHYLNTNRGMWAAIDELGFSVIQFAWSTPNDICISWHNLKLRCGLISVSAVRNQILYQFV